MDKMLKQAIEYHRMGMSVIPVRPDKRPLVRWQQYQRKQATEAEIREWWTRWPAANTGIVTGAISGIDAIDVDSEDAYRTLSDYYIPDSFSSPTYRTPSKGYQIWVRHRPGLVNAADVVPQVVRGVDIRTDGGYTIAPVSRCDYTKHGQRITGSHRWVGGLSPRDVEIAEWPQVLWDTILQAASMRPTSAPQRQADGERAQTQERRGSPWVERFRSRIREGSRDETLFHVANHLVRGGMPRDEVEQFLMLVNETMLDPPMPEAEVRAKIASAMNRMGRRYGEITAALREYVESTTGVFSLQDFFRAAGIPPDLRSSKTASEALSRMVREGLIERHGERSGTFRKIDASCEEIDFRDCSYKPVEISLPLGIHELVEIYPGNMIIVAGVSNTGKTAFMIDTIARNMRRHEVYYYNSEMDGMELRKRLDAYRAVERIEDWTFRSVEIGEQIEHQIRPGEGKLNVIDYLELDSEHYRISGVIRRIHQRLDGAVAIVAIQKRPGASVGVGGYGTIYRARLALNIDSGVCEIVKAKNWRGIRNPNGLCRRFQLIDGWDICGIGDWFRAER